MNNSKSLGQTVIQGSVIAILFTFIGSASAYLVRVIYSRSLSVEMYGLFFAVFGLVNILSSYTGLGFAHAVTYFVPKQFKLKKYHDLWNTFIYGQIIQVGISVLFSAVLIVSASFLSDKYFKVSGAENLIYAFCAFLILTSLINSLLQIFTGLQKVKYYSSINALRTFFVLLFSLFFLFLGIHNTVYYAFAWDLGYLITFLIFLSLLWVKFPHLTNNSIVWRKEIFKAMYKYAIPAFSSTIIFSLMVSADTFLLTLYKGVKEVGVYNVIVPVAAIPVIFLSPLNNVFFPLVSHLYEGEKEKLGYLINKIYEFVPFIGVYFALFVVLFPSSTVGLIFGEKWLGVSQLPLTFLALGYIANLTAGISDTVILGIGKTKARLIVYVLVAIVTVLFHIILISQFGVMGAVMSNNISYLFLALMLTVLIKKVVDFKIPYLFYLKMFLFALLLFITVRLTAFLPGSLPVLILSGILYTILFGLFGYYLKIYDKKILLLIIPKLKSSKITFE